MIHPDQRHRIRNVAYVELGSELNTFSDIPIPRLGLPLLATQARQVLGINGQIFVEDVAPFKPKDLDGADLVCISVLTPTAPQSYELARHLKEEGKLVVLGGIHPSVLTNEALDHSDLVVRGEADGQNGSFLNLLRCLETGGDLSKVNGLSWTGGNGHHFHNPDQPLPSSEILNQLPYPDFRLIRGFENKQPAAISISTLRGCPHGCTFCAVCAFNGRIPRYPSVAWVLGAIKYYAEIYGALRWVFLSDDCADLIPRRLKELLRGLIELRKLGIAFPWGTQVSIRFASDEEILQLAAEAGIDRVFVGCESPNQDSLDECGKKQTVQDIETAVRKMHAHGINVHAMFIAGFDNDPPDIARRIVDFSERLGIESIQILNLTLSPGSEDWHKHVRSGETTLTNNWALFNGQLPTTASRNITPLHFFETTTAQTRRFYSWKNIWRSIWKYARTRNPGDLRTLMIRLSGWKLTRTHRLFRSTRLYHQFLKSHPEKTGVTFETWQLQRKTG